MAIRTVSKTYDGVKEPQNARKCNEIKDPTSCSTCLKSEPITRIHEIADTIRQDFGTSHLLIPTSLRVVPLACLPSPESAQLTYWIPSWRTDRRDVLYPT